MHLTRILICIAATTTFAWPSHAQSEDPEKAACLLAHRDSQVTRKKGAFSEARSQLLLCAKESCPGLVREDCVQWLADLEKVYPVVTFDALVDGRPAADARVFVDGAMVTEHIDGRSVQVDPGRHTFRIEVSGFPPNEQVAVLSEGMQPRTISASFDHPKAAERDLYRPIPVTVWVAGALVVAGAASATIFGVLALSAKKSLVGACAPFCADDQLSGLRRDMLLTDISLGVLGAAAITGLILFLVRPQVERRPQEVHVVPKVSGSGGTLDIVGAF